MSYPLYSVQILNGDIKAVTSESTEIPYVGTATLWLQKPSQTAPVPIVVTCNSAGHWEYPIYFDEPGIWTWVDRVADLGSEPDKKFRVDESFAPEHAP
jgi:hypothetical protein